MHVSYFGLKLLFNYRNETEVCYAFLQMSRKMQLHNTQILNSYMLHNVFIHCSCIFRPLDLAFFRELQAS
jgi:hypothetical protein